MIVLYIALGLVAVIVVIAVIGALLPRSHVATRSATFAHPPEAVWREMIALAAKSEVPLEVVEDAPPRRRVMRISDPKLPFGGAWIYELAPTNGATRLTITEDGFVTNVVFRFMSRFVFGHATGIDKFLRTLQSELRS